MSLPSLPDVPRERRRTATVVAVAALGLLCVVALVIGLRGLLAAPEGTAVSAGSGSSSGSTPPAASASSGSASASPTPSVTPTDLVGFSSPSGNIRCVLSSLGARCDVAQHTWTPPAKPGDCSKDWARGIVVEARGARFTCSNTSAPGGKKLAYGRSVSRGDFRCLSTKDGMTCSGAGHRFSVARASYSLS